MAKKKIIDMAIEAILEKDNKAFKEYLESGMDANIKDEDGNSLLFLAAPYGIEICKMLIDYGADIDKPNKYGNTPLMRAARYGNIAVTELLLEQGADAEVKSKDGFNALIAAESAHEDEVVKVLKNAIEEKSELEDDEELTA